MGVWLKLAAAGKAVWDWIHTPWGQATTQVLLERFAGHRDQQAIAAGQASAEAADDDPATGVGPLSVTPASKALSLDAIERALLDRIKVLTARMPVLTDRKNAMARLLDLAKQLEWVQDRLALRAAEAS